MPAHSSEREISDSEGDASQVETQKRKHSIFSHFPKDRNCGTRLRTKITRVPCRRRDEGSIPRAEKFGNLITADQKVLNEGCESRHNHKYAVVVRDLAKSLKLLKRKIHWNLANPVKNYHGLLTPYRSETNGIAERAIRRVTKGTSAVLLQSELDDKWRSDSMECCCYLRNVQDLLADGKTLYERRFGESFKGPIIPSGAQVEYLPNSKGDKARIHQFGIKVLLGFLKDLLRSRRSFGNETF